MSQYTAQKPKKCQIRHFRSGDRDQLIRLHDTVFGHNWGHDWFEWKFENNPYVDHVPVIVATRDDQIVGCRAFFALEMRVGATTRIGLQPCDTMVHPDHRRQGLFSRMNELALEYYADRRPDFFFNFPNEHSKRGNLKHGWKVVGTVPMYYRLHDPVALAEKRVESDRSKELVHAYSDLQRAASAIADEFTSPPSLSERWSLDTDLEGVRIERYETPPCSLLASIERESAGIHANRSPEFYRWRLANPEHDYVTYMAKRDGDALAAVVVSCVDDCVRLIELVPREFSARENEIDRLVRTVISEYSNRSYFTAFGIGVPNPVRNRFFPDTRVPLSLFVKSTARTLLARDIGDATVVEDSSPAEWGLTRLDLDTT
ncbi:GNAT family N-acetyltransferase [Natrarchaeobius chitinivorans]|uniref:GNAT family N-acetyltransferase n=1 Tax=Natrarchaeobius chitinivorans TaxID=1679083 RepID=A0A3N6MZE3_NATCH|nr:GNAT family N-acetyltransferase [Natrarchaeobius chitinivorans]RQG90962.1 GNAT family N-acetyltransferase [Natrarchaeobius chitinivorans]